MRTPSLTLLAAAAAIVVFGVIRILKAVVSKGKLDVGSVSDRWIAEHRAGSGDDIR